MSYFELVLSEKQEELLTKQFKIDIENKQKEIKQIEKNTKKIQKYSAYFYVKKEPLIEISSFDSFNSFNSFNENVVDNVILNVNNEKSKCTFRLVHSKTNIYLNNNNKIIYKIDSELTDEIIKILSVYCNNNYIINLTIKSKDNSGLYYVDDGHPVYLEIIDKSQAKIILTRTLEIFDKYDLVCG